MCDGAVAGLEGEPSSRPSGLLDLRMYGPRNVVVNTVDGNPYYGATVSYHKVSLDHVRQKIRAGQRFMRVLE